MKKEIIFDRANDEAKSKVSLYLEKKVCIDDLFVEYELELKRKGFKSIKKKLKPTEIKKSKLNILNDFGLNADILEFDGYNLIESIKNAANILEDQFIHKNVGWFELEEGLSFKGKILYGSKIKSRLDGDNFNIEDKGNLDVWVNGLNKYILKNSYMELMLVAGFSSVLVNLLNMDYNLGSIILNCSGALNRERSLIFDIINSTWTNPNDTNSGLKKVLNANTITLVDSMKQNSGLSISIDYLNKQNILVDLVNLIQTNNINNTVIINSNEFTINEDKNSKNILRKGSILEINLDTYNLEELKDNFNQIDEIIKLNYGKAGEGFISYIFNSGIDTLKDKFESIKNEVYKEFKEIRLDYNKIMQISVILLTGQYVMESLGLNINLEQLKDTLMDLENNNKEVLQYNKALNDMVSYFNKNKNKYILRGDDIKSNTEGLYDVNGDGQINKIIIPHYNFDKIIDKLGYNKAKTLKAWKHNDLLEYEKERNNKQVTFGIDKTRCIVLKIKEGDIYG